MNVQRRSTTLRMPRKDNAKPMKMRPWSHQNELKEHIGKKIAVMSVEGDEYEGVLVNADAYTIQIRHVQDIKSEVTDVFFKHAIGAYRLLND